MLCAGLGTGSNHVVGGLPPGRDTGTYHLPGALDEELTPSKWVPGVDVTSALGSGLQRSGCRR